MNNLKYFIKLFVFWLIYFFVNRLFFIVNYFEEFSQVTTTELLRIFPKSLGLDISFITYLSVIITILLFLNSKGLIMIKQSPIILLANRMQRVLIVATMMAKISIKSME